MSGRPVGTVEERVAERLTAALGEYAPASPRFTRVFLAKTINVNPGIETNALWNIAKRRLTSITVWQFDAELAAIRATGEYRVTNKSWYRAGFETARAPKRGPKANKKQLSLFGGNK